MKVKSIKVLEESIISTIKSISQNKKISVEFELENIDFLQINQNSFLQNKKISLPKINNGEEIRIAEIRAVADMAALYLKFHQAKIHKKYNFESDYEQKLFDNFEKLRLIIKGGNLFKGVGINISKLINYAIDNFTSETDFLPLLLLRKLSLNSEKIKNHLLVFEKILSADLNKKINSLIELNDNQEKFAVLAEEIIFDLKNSKNKSEDKNKNQSAEPEDMLDEGSSPQNNSANEEKIDDKKNISKAKKEELIPTENNFSASQLFDLVSDEEEGDENAATKNSQQNLIKFIPEYKIFTKKYDQIVKAEDLSSKPELANLRLQLDIKLSKLGNISNRLTSKLKRKLLSKKNVFYSYNKEEGIIDRKKITQLIASPLRENNYVTINDDEYQDTVICLLLDNSGSMRGSPIVMSAMVCEIISKILESFAIKTEILGFTTCDWRGGKARKLWEISGKPKNPGRLSDIRHIIYKNANQSFKKSKINLGLMLKEGILKENIDGEALNWAATRMINRSEKRKILLVISDGTPVDDSTNSNNDRPILEDHLHQAISKLEKHSGIEIAAIGIGHNISDYYYNSMTINNLDELGDVMIDRICDLI